MEPIKIFVADSYGSTEMAEALQFFYGPTVLVHCEIKGMVKNVISELAARDVFKNSAPLFIDPSEHKNFALFFLSARLIEEGALKPIELKEAYGIPTAKIIAMSAKPYFKEEIEHLQKTYNVDYFQNKVEFQRVKMITDAQEKESQFPFTYLREALNE